MNGIDVERASYGYARAYRNLCNAIGFRDPKAELQRQRSIITTMQNVFPGLTRLDMFRRNSGEYIVVHECITTEFHNVTAATDALADLAHEIIAKSAKYTQGQDVAYALSRDALEDVLHEFVYAYLKMDSGVVRNIKISSIRSTIPELNNVILHGRANGRYTMHYDGGSGNQETISTNDINEAMECMLDMCHRAIEEGA